MDRELFVKRLSSLVSKRTYSGDIVANSDALDLVASWVDSKCKIQRMINGKSEILLLGSGNLLRPKLGYLVHMDVVVGNKEQFVLKEENGKLIGRGASDMKFSIPIGVEILNRVITEKMNNDFTLAITTDEEIGGCDGGKYLAEVIEFRPKVLFVPDGGDNFVLVNKSKGVVHVSVNSFGQPAHASEPWLGKNAIKPLVRLSSQLLDRYEVNDLTDNWSTTMNLGVINGGMSTNQVCDMAELKIDFRFPESRSVQEIYKEVCDLAKKVDKTLVVKITASGNPTFTDKESKTIKVFLRVFEKFLGYIPSINGDCGASDARYWANFKVPTIMIKPHGGGAHGNDEWISVDSCLKFFEIVWKFLAVL